MSVPRRRLHAVAEGVAFFNELEGAVAPVVHDAALQLAAGTGVSVYAGFERDFANHLVALIDLITELRARNEHLEVLEGEMTKSSTRPSAGTNTGGAVRDARKRALRDFSPLAWLLGQLLIKGEIGDDDGSVSALISYLKKPTPYR